MVSLVASIVSVVLGVFAIWLSIAFYRMSTESSARIEKAADRIGASVDRLEMLFNKLYSDTFSMVRESVADMRKHVWSSPASAPASLDAEVAVKADQKIAEIRVGVEADLAKLLQSQESTDLRIGTLAEQVRQLVTRTISETRSAEATAREETLRQRIVRVVESLRTVRGSVTAAMIVEALAAVASQHEVTTELFRMRAEGFLTWPREESLGWDDPITLTPA